MSLTFVSQAATGPLPAFALCTGPGSCAFGAPSSAAAFCWSGTAAATSSGDVPFYANSSGASSFSNSTTPAFSESSYYATMPAEFIASSVWPGTMPCYVSSTTSFPCTDGCYVDPYFLKGTGGML